MNFLVFFFSCIIIYSSFLVLLSKNPVHSILYLILTFISTTGLLLLLQIEFIGIMLMIIYVGAVSILFLFVIMMLNIKLIDLQKSLLLYFPISIIILVILGFELFNSVYISSFIISSILYNDWYNHYILGNNIENLAYLIYYFFIDYLFLSGLALFLSILSIVCLTLKVDLNVVKKKQDLYLQIRKNSLVNIRYLNLYNYRP